MYDLRELISGFITIALISISIGKFNDLHAFSKRQAAKSLRGWPAHHFFRK